jgi:hypothetical protein
MHLSFGAVLILVAGVVAFLGIILFGWTWWLTGLAWLAFSVLAYRLTKPRDPWLEK